MRMSALKDWSLEGGNEIVKERVFENPAKALEFISKVVELGEKHNHMPKMLFDKVYVRLTLTTFEEKALTEKDFALAQDIDKI